MKIIPPTPNAAGLGQFGNVPIGLYTGQPNISFPLYNIVYNDLTVPIDLSYNYSGLKVEDYPGWVGTGWNVGGTGVINRQQRSVADESLYGYNGQAKTGLKVMEFINNPSKTVHATYLQSVLSGQKDSEPDMFTFSFPGHSGKFFFDETQCETTVKQAVVIPQQKMKVTGYFNYAGTYNWSPGIIEKFVITDEKGIRYTFDVMESAASEEPGDPDVENFANTWYLSEIETPNGNIVGYEYRSRVMVMPATVYEKRTLPLTQPNPTLSINEPLVRQFTSSSTNEAVLERITFRGGYVDFVEGDVRQDWDPSTWSRRKEIDAERLKTLSKIRVYISGMLVKDVEFSYSYFGQNARLRLDSFREVNGGVSKPPHVFTYKEGIFPAIGNENSLYQQDHWGFYKGTSEETLLPPYSDVQIQLNGSFRFVNIPGNDRTPSPFAASAGILTQITYPTQGYTSFEYEPNEYWGRTWTNLCAGEFVSQGMAGAEVTEGDDSETYELTLASMSCLKVTYSLSAPCVDGLVEVKLVNSDGVEVLRHSIERKKTGIQQSNFGPSSGETFPLDAGTYTLVATAINENTCGSTTKAKATVWKIVQDSLGHANLQAGGLRVARVQDCADPQQCVTTKYDYHDVTNSAMSSGRLINDPVYKYYQTVAYSLEHDVNQNTMVYEVPCLIFFAHSQVPLASSSGGVVGYKYVTVTREGDLAGSRTEYRFTTGEDFPELGSMDYPFPPLISNDYKRSKQVNKKDFRDNSVSGSEIVAEQPTDYWELPTYSRQIGFKPKKDLDSRTEDRQITLADYSFVPYPVSSGWAPLRSQQEVQYDYSEGVSQQLSKTQSFFYDNPYHLQVSRIITRNSKDEELITTMKYVEEAGTIPGLTLQEISDIQSNPDKTALVQKQEFNGSNLLSTTLNVYDGPLLKKVRFSSGTAPLEEYVNYNAYDDFGNVLNFTTKSGQKNSYQWAYGMKLPVVEARNAEHTDVFFTSFEEIGTIFEDGSGNNLAFSGAKVHNSGSYTVPSSFTPSSPSNTVMSYWYWHDNKWKFSGVVPFNSSIVSPGTKVDEVRAFPKGAQVTTLTYDPAIGVTGVADVNSFSAHYEYDALGRLLRIRDFKGNIVKAFTYHYKTD